MESTALRFRQALTARGLKQADIVERTGIGKSSISTYLTGEYVPKQKNLYLMAKALDVDPAWLMGADIPMGSFPLQPQEEEKAPKKQPSLGQALPMLGSRRYAPGGFRSSGPPMLQQTPQVPYSIADILKESAQPNPPQREAEDQAWGKPLLTAYAASGRPKQDAVCAVLGISHVDPNAPAPPQKNRQSLLIYDFPAAAGPALYAEDSYERIAFDEDEIPSGADFGIRISGDSMEPTIPDGSIAFLHKQPDLQNGQIGIFMIDDSAVCKRFYRQASTITLRSDNPAHKDIIIKEYQTFYVVGRVLGWSQGI